MLSGRSGPERPGEPLDLRRERTPRLLELALQRDLAESAAVARDLLPQPGQGLLAGGVDEQRAGVARELVADGPVHRPVAQPLVGVEDLLDPHPPSASFTQPGQISRRIGEAIGVVDPQPVDEAVSDEREDQLVRLLEHDRVLLADAREVVDVEEPPVAPRGGVDVEEPRPELWIGPVSVVVVGRHVVGDNVEDQPDAGVAGRSGEPLELLGAPERVGQAARVDHVVAVGGAGPRL